MKAFLLAIAALVAITVGANVMLTDTIGVSSAERTAARDVRLPEEVATARD